MMKHCFVSNRTSTVFLVYASGGSEIMQESVIFQCTAHIYVIFFFKMMPVFCRL
jgi:hypothetical protein